MTSRPLVALLAGLTAASTVAVPARAATPPTAYGVIASTQGTPPDTFAEHVRLYEAHRARYGALDAQNRDLSLEQVPGAVDHYRGLVRTSPIG